MVDSRINLEYFARMMLPGICTLLLYLLSLVPLGIAGTGHFPPIVILISIYYWSIFRPGAMPFWFVFFLGLVRDALFGVALGMSSLLFIFFRLLVLSQQRYLIKETFWAMWVGFGLVTIPALAMEWLLASAYQKSLIPIVPVLMQWVFTAGFYPLLHIIFNAIYRCLPVAYLGGKPHSVKL